MQKKSNYGVIYRFQLPENVNSHLKAHKFLIFVNAKRMLEKFVYEISEARREAKFNSKQTKH